MLETGRVGQGMSRPDIRYADDFVILHRDLDVIRRLIWEAVKDRSKFFSDGRMSAEVLRVLTACDTASREHYPTTLFAAGEAYAGSCTAKTTIYCANIAAGMMLAQFAKWLRSLPVESDIQLNLLSAEIAVSP